MRRILIIEDDTSFSNLLKKFLEKQSYKVTTGIKVSEAIGLITSRKYDLLLLDYRLPDGTALDLMGCHEFQNNRLPVIIMTTFNDVRIAVKAMKMGAMDYITKPINTEELMMSIDDTLKFTRSGRSGEQGEDWIKGKSEASKNMHKYIELVAPTDMSALIQGESGTGKEYVARLIHRQSLRADQPFVAVDCGALSPELAASELFGHTKGSFTSAIQDKKGYFETADGGTLFLDEISNLSYGNQMKLLRVIQEKSVQPIGSNKVKKIDVRIITATNDDLFYLVKNEDFREDLYHRINEFKILVPSLRARAEDLDLFIQHFIAEANRRLKKEVKGFNQDMLDFFTKYSWPGNLRELNNVVKRAVLLTESPHAGMECLPQEMLYSTINDLNSHTYSNGETNDNRRYDSTDLKALQEQNERLLIVNTLEKVRHNKSKAAKLLNIDRKTLYNKLSRYKIQ